MMGLTVFGETVEGDAIDVIGRSHLVRCVFVASTMWLL